MQAAHARVPSSTGAVPALGVGCDGNVLVAPLDDELPIVSSARSGRFISSIAVKQLAIILDDEELWRSCPRPEEVNGGGGGEGKERAGEQEKRKENNESHDGKASAIFDREGRLDLLSVVDADYSTARVRADAPLGEVILFFSLKPAHGRVFVTESGVLVGSVCSSDLFDL